MAMIILKQRAVDVIDATSVPSTLDNFLTQITVSIADNKCHSAYSW